MSARVEPVLSGGSVRVLILAGADLSRSHLSSFLRLSLEFASDFGKESEGETSSRLPVTDATFAVACLAALNPIGSIQTVSADPVLVPVLVLVLVELAE